MATFSKHFNLNKAQGELDFVDVRLNRDTPLFVDPFAISQRPDRWSQHAYTVLTSYFQKIVDFIRSGRQSDARQLLSFLREPNETRFGLSRKQPKGSGIGAFQADQLLKALSASNAVRTGFLTSLEECELMIEGISWDKVSDLTTNAIRGELAQYTADQCALHGVPTQEVALGAHFSLDVNDWVNDYLRLPVVSGKPVLLVPKAIARYEPAYDHREYHRNFALRFLQNQHLSAGSSLVRALKNGNRIVYKKDVQKILPCTKERLFEFSKKNPTVLAEYRQHLAALEKKGNRSVVADEDEPAIASALIKALRSIPPGGGRATEYHNLMIGIIEIVFFPMLIHPVKEKEIHQGRKRIDIVMDNAATSGPLYVVHSVKKIPAAYIVFECKNYQTDIANPELDQISSRFSANRGKVGFACCRRFEDRSLFVERCRDTFRDDRGLIVPLDDDTVVRWLELIRGNARGAMSAAMSEAVNEICFS